MSFKETKVMTAEERADYNSKRRERYKNDPRYRQKEICRSLDYQKANKEEVAKKRKKYYENNKEACKARTKAWMVRNREYWIKYVMEYQKRKKDES